MSPDGPTSPAARVERCPTCGGLGEVDAPRDTDFRETCVCGECQGTGRRARPDLSRLMRSPDAWLAALVEYGDEAFCEGEWRAQVLPVLDPCDHLPEGWA